MAKMETQAFGRADAVVEKKTKLRKWGKKKKQQQDDGNAQNSSSSSMSIQAEESITDRTTPNLASAQKWKQKKLAHEKQKQIQDDDTDDDASIATDMSGLPTDLCVAASIATADKEEPVDNDATSKTKSSKKKKKKKHQDDNAHDTCDDHEDHAESKKKKKGKKQPDTEDSSVVLNTGEDMNSDHKPTQGTFDWSTVRENLDQLTLKSEKYVKKRTKLQQKMEQLQQDKAQQLADIRQALQTEKDQLDEQRHQAKKEYKQHLEEVLGDDMTYEDLCAKATELQQIIQTIKISNAKHRSEIEQHDQNLQQLTQHNAKLEVAVEQSTTIVQQVKEAKAQVATRHEQLTRAILPALKQSLTEFINGVEECKSHARVEERGRIRYGNFILKTMRLVIASAECDEDFQLDVADRAGGCEGGTLPPLQVKEEHYDDFGLEDSDVPKGLVDYGDGKEHAVKGTDNATQEDVDETSVGGRHSGEITVKTTTGGDSVSTASTSNVAATTTNESENPATSSTGLLNPAHQELLQAAKRASSFQNGAVVLSDSEGDDGSDSSDYNSD